MQPPQADPKPSAAVDTCINTTRPGIGVVVIGRNEGERLKRCLRSLMNQVGSIVYVDSGSTDGSGDFARSLGVEVIDLDMNQPFTMARGRNAGWQFLAAQDDAVEFVQFVDGDCEVVDGWIESALGTLQAREDVVAVYGRRRERFPKASIYNGITDLEWDHPVGESKACGGDALFRLSEIARVDGYNEQMIAGEEAEMCLRIRRHGWIILRIDAEMTLHDAALTNFSQWWKRAIRGGHAYAEGAAMHGRSAERHNVRQVTRVILWGLIPLVICLISVFVSIGLESWLLLAITNFVIAIILIAQTARVYRMTRKRGYAARICCFHAYFNTIAKFAQLIGLMVFLTNRLRGKQSVLMEYDKQSNRPTLRSKSGVQS